MKFYYFNRCDESAGTLTKLRDIAHKYGFATVADLKDLYRGGYSHFEDRTIGWTAEMLCDVYTKYTNEDGFCLGLPDPIPIETEYIDNDNRQCTSSEPIFITIHANELDLYDPEKIISSVLNEVTKIKDRTVNIMIM